MCVIVKKMYVLDTRLGSTVFKPCFDLNKKFRGRDVRQPRKWEIENVVEKERERERSTTKVGTIAVLVSDDFLEAI